MRYNKWMLNWLVIGIGDITRRRVMPAILHEPRSRLQAVVTRDPQKAVGLSGVQAFTSLDEALQNAPIDAVYVASPVFLHASQTIACLNAGKHVLCEKPTAMSFKEAQMMVEVARGNERLLAVAYYRRLFPKLVRARQLISQGAIGQPVYAEANSHGWLQENTTDGPRSWLVDPAKSGGGSLYDIASHRIDALNFLFGKPSHATGLLSNTVHRFAVEDSATVLIQYSGGIHAAVDARWNSRIARDRFLIIGTEGELNLDPLSGPPLHMGAIEESLPTHPNVHYPLIENFVAAVLDGSPLACPGEEAIWTDWVTQMARVSAR